MKGIGDDKAPEVKAPDKKEAKPVVVAPKTMETVSVKETPAVEEEAIEAKPVKKFEGKGLAGVVKKLSEEKLEDKAKRITDKLDKNPDKKDKTIEKEKRAPKVAKEDKPATKKTTKK